MLAVHLTFWVDLRPSVSTCRIYRVTMASKVRLRSVHLRQFDQSIHQLINQRAGVVDKYIHTTAVSLLVVEKEQPASTPRQYCLIYERTPQTRLIYSMGIK